MNLATVKAFVKTALTKQMFSQLRLAAVSHAKVGPAICPVCRYEGYFGPFGMPLRTGVMCPNCWSLERQRQLTLSIERGEIDLNGRDIVHFAPEAGLADTILRQAPRSYLQSDFDQGLDLQLDLEAIELPDASIDLVIANHVLEHVNDRKALAEIYRVLREGGEFLCMIPIVEGWAETYENPSIVSPAERERHFGQFDHVRFYGRDVRDRFTEAGFELRELTAATDDVLLHRLNRGETIFIGRK